MVEYAYKWIEAYLSGEAVNEKYTILKCMPVQ